MKSSGKHLLDKSESTDKWGEFHGKKHAMCDKEEVGIPTGDGTLSTVVSLRNQRGAWLKEFRSTAPSRAFLGMDELHASLTSRSKRLVEGSAERVTDQLPQGS